MLPSGTLSSYHGTIDRKNVLVNIHEAGETTQGILPTKSHVTIMRSSITNV